MKSKLSGIALVLFLTGAATAQTAHPAPGCNNRDFVGAYGMFATGSILQVPLNAVPTGPFTRVGRVVVDGNGNVSVNNTASYDGNIVTESYSGTYTVRADCSLTINVLVSLAALGNVPFAFTGALSNKGDNAAVVVCGIGAPCSAAPTGAVLCVLLARQSVFSQWPCATWNLAGSFAVDMSGSVITTNGPIPFARDGIVTFDGRGGFTGHDTVNTGIAAPATETLAGTYSVDSSCQITINYSLGGAHVWTGMLTNQSDSADLIVAETGVVISGTLMRIGGGFGPF